MKILITGAPKTGKSTVLNNFIDLYTGSKTGFVVSRMLDRNNINQGFTVNTLDGRIEILSHKKLIKSDILIGNGHKVDLEVVDNFMANEVVKALDLKEELFIFDEIGRMELLSSKFINACRQLFESDINFIGTIMYDDEDGVAEFKDHSNVLLIEVTESNRDHLPKILQVIFDNLESFRNLTESQQNFVIEELEKFISEDQLIQAKKLFDNAIVYVSNKLVEKVKDDNEIEAYEIRGKTNDHVTYYNRKDALYTCDCDLFNGRGQFEEKPGECSHIETIKILRH